MEKDICYKLEILNNDTVILYKCKDTVNPDRRSSWAKVGEFHSIARAEEKIKMLYDLELSEQVRETRLYTADGEALEALDSK